ncbi:sugar ABC transporter ATP-binding protein [Limnoglobus roseus]
MTGVRKAFPGVQALADARLEVRAGEVVALMGENGAGKSTLIKTLAGVHRPDAGTIRIDGTPRVFHSPNDARAAGVAVIYQELDLIPTLSARENLFLGQEKARFGWLRAGEERRRAAELFAQLDVAIDPETPVARLSVAQQQAVAVARALLSDARILVMDEPTAPLTPREVGKLFRVVRDLTARGLGIVFISHRLDETFEIADRVTIMRDGSHVETLPTSQITREAIIERMVGRPLADEFPKERTATGLVVLRAENLRRGAAVRGVSLDLRAGEVVGLTGLVGAGRTELVRLLFGADPLDSGRVLLDGEPVSLRSPRDALRHGICLLTEDRKGQGLVIGASVRENFGLPNLDRFSTAGVVRAARERERFAHFRQQLAIRVADAETPARNLSGGNQQKVVLAKWLEADMRVVIFDEPTRGIDVGAKREIYLLLNALARAGKAILMVSSELPEVLGMSDRVLVMREGRISGEFDNTDPRVPVTQEQVMRLAVP